MSNLSFKRVALTLLAICGMIAAPLLVAAPASAHSSAPTSSGYNCQANTLQVVVPGDTVKSDVVGKLCAYGSPLGKPLQFTVAGLSYKGDTYWDNPNPTYAYARAAALSGFAVYVYDQIGSGGLSANPVAGISLQDQMEVMHQLIVQFRTSGVAVEENGKNKTYNPNKLIVVGHSLGAEEAMLLGAKYADDADAFELQSYLHVSNPAGGALVGQYRVSAPTSTSYADATKWSNYVTTADGPTAIGHRDIFYYTPNADPTVIAADEATKGVSPVKVAVQANLERTTPVSPQIKKPILLVTGEFDILNCDASVAGLSCASSSAVKTRESQYYVGSTCFTAYTIPNVGHDVNLHKLGSDKPSPFTVENAWALATLYAPSLLRYLNYC
jgi:pimeloyl-ACP methyl ester carboxylesterase